MVPSAEAKAAAEENAWKARGVKRVVNRLQVVPPSKQEAVKAHDDRVERAVRKALESRPELGDGPQVGPGRPRGRPAALAEPPRAGLVRRGGEQAMSPGREPSPPRPRRS